MFSGAQAARSFPVLYCPATSCLPCPALPVHKAVLTFAASSHAVQGETYRQSAAAPYLTQHKLSQHYIITNKAAMQQQPVSECSANSVSKSVDNSVRTQITFASCDFALTAVRLVGHVHELKSNAFVRIIIGTFSRLVVSAGSFGCVQPGAPPSRWPPTQQARCGVYPPPGRQHHRSTRGSGCGNCRRCHRRSQGWHHPPTPILPIWVNGARGKGMPCPPKR